MEILLECINIITLIMLKEWFIQREHKYKPFCELLHIAKSKFSFLFQFHFHSIKKSLDIPIF